MKEQLQKLKEESKKTGLSESTLLLLKKFQLMYDELNSLLARSMKHAALSCETVPTVGGAVVEEFANPNVKPSMHCTVTMTKLGANPVSILAAKCEMGKVVVTFNADPSNDHELTYHICK